MGRHPLDRFTASKHFHNLQHNLEDSRVDAFSILFEKLEKAGSFCYPFASGRRLYRDVLCPRSAILMPVSTRLLLIHFWQALNFQDFSDSIDYLLEIPVR